MILQFMEKNIGNKVYIKGSGDLAFSSEFRDIIKNKIPLKIVKLTKSGLVYLVDNKNNFYTVPLRNILYDNNDSDKENL
jgi:hypothetical protein